MSGLALAVREMENECEWYRKMLEINKNTTRGIRRGEHSVDAYDVSSNRGIVFQHSDISPEDVTSRESITELDWILDTTGQFCCMWDEIACCEIPSGGWEKAIHICRNNVILDTGMTEWILLDDKRSFFIEIDDKTRCMWIGKPITLEEVIEITCLKNTLTEGGKEKVNGRCNKS